MTARALISLAESNKRVAEQRAAAEYLENRGLPNGIACPTCGWELHDKGSPFPHRDGRRQDCRCHGCGWMGAREC